MKQFSLNKIKSFGSIPLSTLQILVERLVFYSIAMRVWFRDVEAVKFLMHPLSALLEVLCFRVRFCFLTFGNFCLRFKFRKELVAFEFASASSLFYPFPQKFNRLHSFGFQLPLPHPCL